MLASLVHPRKPAVPQVQFEGLLLLVFQHLLHNLEAVNGFVVPNGPELLACHVNKHQHQLLFVVLVVLVLVLEPP